METVKIHFDKCQADSNQNPCAQYKNNKTESKTNKHYSETTSVITNKMAKTYHRPKRKNKSTKQHKTLYIKVKSWGI